MQGIEISVLFLFLQTAIKFIPVGEGQDSAPQLDEGEYFYSLRLKVNALELLPAADSEGVEEDELTMDGVISEDEASGSDESGPIDPTEGEVDDMNVKTHTTSNTAPDFVLALESDDSGETSPAKVDSPSETTTTTTIEPISITNEGDANIPTAVMETFVECNTISTRMDMVPETDTNSAVQATTTTTTQTATTRVPKRKTVPVTGKDAVMSSIRPFQDAHRHVGAPFATQGVQPLPLQNFHSELELHEAPNRSLNLSVTLEQHMENLNVITCVPL